MLDDMDLERQRGITIKARAVGDAATTTRARTYELNLIDTPGHVDFHYEVSRAWPAAKGRCCWSMPSKGVEAQTVANAYAAMKPNLTIVPVINKIDLVQRPARRSDC